MKPEVVIIGGGLAGSEAAWQIAERGIKVVLYEMRPKKLTPVHHTDKLAELVCSNSFRSNMLDNAVGLLKEEMRRLNSIIMKCADKSQIPAGRALAVDRDLFSQMVTEQILKHPNIKLIRDEIKQLPYDKPVIVASGPLTSDSLVKDIIEKTGSGDLYFYDAAAPVISGDTIDYSKTFWGSRYDADGADYLNCPLTEEEYDIFYNELIRAERYKRKEFEEEKYFEGCMPIEVIADRGPKTLLFGPMKPVGLYLPDGTRPFAVVQLRKENKAGSMFNMVGFQTSLKWGEQKRVFRLIPALKNAEFLRYGFIHRNTYINSPKILLPTLQFKNNKNVFFAGQITGVEGYVESAACGLVAGINMTCYIKGYAIPQFPKETVIGALINYITNYEREYQSKDFQPMKANFGILPPLDIKVKDKKLKRKIYSERSLKGINNFLSRNKMTMKF